MKLAEIAAKIDGHLKRFESDKEMNALRGSKMRTTPYYHAASWANGRFVYVRYISYQLQSHLAKDEALCYLAWLDAGNVGRHYEALRARLEEKTVPLPPTPPATAA